MPNKPKSEAQGIQLSYRYRIYPTPEQEKALAFEFDACRYVYNHFLHLRTESWERTQKTLRRPKLAPGADPNARHPEYVKDSNGKTVWEEYVNESYDPEAKSMGSTPSKMLTALKNSCLDEDGNLWLKQADSTALGYSTMNLDAAFDNFFRGRKKGQNIGYPRFKRRFDSAQSYKTQGGQLLGTYPDGNFFEFNRQLAYKSAWANRAFVEVPNDTPTAQVCSRCGHEELVLAKDLRPKWTCHECGAQHDRKANGAQNVLEAGLDILAKQERSFVTKAKKSRTKKRAK